MLDNIGNITQEENRGQELLMGLILIIGKKYLMKTYGKMEKLMKENARLKLSIKY